MLFRQSWKQRYAFENKIIGLHFEEFDSRRAAILRQRSKISGEEDHIKDFEDYMHETKENIARAIAEGLKVLISVDDSQFNYENIYEPDFKDYASKECFPIELLNPSQLKIPKVILNL